MSSLGDQVKVPAVVDLQLATGDQPMHDPRIDQRDDRVVIAGQYQGGLKHQRQQRQARPVLMPYFARPAGDRLVPICRP